MNSYKLLAGKHEEAGREYRAGEIVRSRSPLDRLFPGKFEPVPNPPAPAKTASQPPRTAASQPAGSE